jgi:hypothetical protein
VSVVSLHGKLIGRLPLLRLTFVSLVPLPSLLGSAPVNPRATALSSIQTSVAFLLVHDNVMSLSSVDAPQLGGVIVIDNRVAGPRGALDVLLAGAEDVGGVRLAVGLSDVVGAALTELGALDDVAEATAARLPLPDPVTVLEQAARLRLPASRTVVGTASR